MNRATATTLAVVISLSGTGPLLAQGAEPNDSPSRERILKLLQQPEGSVLPPEVVLLRWTVRGRS